MGETLEKKTLKFSKNFDSLSDAYVERYRDFMKNPAPLQEQFAKDMLDLILNDVDTNCITVIPGRCGISKSIFVQSIISFFLRGADYKFRYDGTIKLIIITDMMRRLKDYQRPPERPQSVWFSDTSDRLKHNKYCAYLTSDPKDNDGKTAMEQLVQSYYKPIVLLSTQRYFTMSDDQREMLFKCKKGTREIVIFDEKPQFYTSKKITAKNFALCAAAIQHGIPKSEGEVKKIYLDEFWNFRKKMETLLRDKERAKFNGPVDQEI